MGIGRVRQLVRYLLAAIVKHNIGILAAVIAFFGFSAMIPLLLLLTYGASILIPHIPIQHFLSGVLKSYVPTIPDTQSYLTLNVARMVELGPKVGLLGVLGLLWTAVGGFVSFQQILDVIWETEHRRSFVKQYLVGFGMLGILLLLTIVSSLVTAVSPAFVHRVLGSHESLNWVFLVHQISRVLLPLLLFITCYFCYRFLPSRTLPSAYLMVGALISTLGIYLSRQIFVWYTRHLGRFELIYGTLTFIMLFVFWMYIVSMIVLFGAEFALSLRAVVKPGQVPDDN